MPHQIETPEREVLSFLTKAWSENKRAHFRWAPPHEFSANTRSQTVFISNIKDASFPELAGFNRWRVWRFLSFHESMHLKLSPKMTPREYVSSQTSSDWSIVEKLYRIFEDVRIENIGLKTYVGYVSEQKFYDTFMFARSMQVTQKTLTGTLDPFSAFSPYERWWTELVYRVLYNRSVIKISDITQEAKIASIVDTAYSLTESKEAIDLAIKTAEWIRIIFQTQIAGSNLNMHSGLPIKVILTSGSSPFSPRQLADLQGVIIEVDAREGSDAIQKEFEILQQENRTLDEQVDPADAALQDVNKNIQTCDAEARIPEVQVQKWDDLMQHADGLIAILKSNLRRWRVGWSEVLSEEGDDLDSEAPILARLQKNGFHPKIFLDEKRVGSRGKLAVLVDMSGSIGAASATDAYLSAGGIISEALSFVRSSFELYAFNTVMNEAKTSHVAVLWLLKTFKEPWSVEQRERLANMIPSGNTPLHRVLSLIRSRLKQNNVKRLVILTDGCPDNIDDAAKEVSYLVNEGVKVLFMGIKNANLDLMRQMLSFKHASERIVYIDEVSELPSAFFKLLQSTV